MISFLPENDDRILIAKAEEKLTAKDYEDVFIPRLEKMLQKNKKLNLVFYLSEGFRGWELGAAWDDAKFGLMHRHDFGKIAVVGGPKWVEWCTKVGAHLVKGEVKVYKENELEVAIKWVREM
jgi:hypothetical protein